ncbi:putative DNA-directed RNA polymerase I and III subunit Rpc40 [Ascobolus immersus RN42]|uniref:DNA-directed RNA polymerases I and III subunit RPAC1 n=1 Tax=Ascobolus immersus RN42 TaxID=1160509 RepID=A0A3N4IL57_ASCIM|nr:putative DNA-directed RNA polymerase I and III subunit Rpc40 [Ascobolus immersus RN42]
MAPSKKSEQIDPRRIIKINEETVTNVAATDFPGHYPGEDHAWDLNLFRKNLKVEFHKNKPLHAEFDLIGVDAAIANAFRRILIAEVPGLAIEYVYIQNNTSIIQDEVLSHRLGLLPLRGNKEAFDKMAWFKKPEAGEPTLPTERDTIVLTLKATCEKNKNAKKDEEDPNKLFINNNVYARDVVFEPHGSQKALYKKDPIRPTNPGILIAKLRPGQEIDLIMHAIKGVGKDHAKFSPVATASYRLLPMITIKEPIEGELADKFAKCFPKGVIEVTTDKKGVKTAKVADPRRDTVSRECLRHKEFQGIVELGRIRDHFIFSVESTGMHDSDELFLQSVAILKEKCKRLRSKLQSIE